MYCINTVDLAASSLPQKEILRYMRAGAEPPDEVVTAARNGAQRVISAAVGRGCYIRLPLERTDGGVRICELDIKSSSLYTHLDGCDEVFVIGVTAGVGVDRAIRAAETEGILTGLAADAAGSALVEELCDILCHGLLRQVSAEECTLTRRFSPGYGDLSLEYQRQISAMLNTLRNIGAALTDGAMMSPTKTVTAIVGIKK